jgi:hypothetical protein
VEGGASPPERRTVGPLKSRSAIFSASRKLKAVRLPIFFLHSSSTPLPVDIFLLDTLSTLRGSTEGYIYQKLFKSVGICGFSLTHIQRALFVARKSTTRSNQRAYGYYEGFRLVFSALVGTRALKPIHLWHLVGFRGLEGTSLRAISREPVGFCKMRHPVEQAIGA